MARTGDAAEAHAEAVGEREAPLQHDEVAVRQKGRVGDVERIGALEREGAGVTATDDEAAVVAGAVERMLGDEHDGAGERPAVRRHGDGFQPLVAGQVVDELWQGDVVAAGVGNSGGGGETPDRRLLLEGDIGGLAAVAADDAQALGVGGALAGEAVPARIEHRRQHRPGDAGRPAVGLLQRRDEPVAGIGDSVEGVAVRPEIEPGERAEAAIAGDELQPAEKFQLAELHLGGAEGEVRERPHGDVDRRETGAVLGQRHRRQQSETGDESGDEPPRRHCRAGRFWRGWRAGWATGRSSKSSASLSVMAPASSSASTMVTARR